jgi:hypothetical protein
MVVTVQYAPGNPNPWSQVPGTTVPVPPGSTELNWKIQVIPASAGAIAFSSPGIQFTGTGTNSWPGTSPTGNASEWTSTINNTLPRGANSASFYYQVNALFTPTNGTQVAVTYDPDVEENPPTLVVVAS